MTINQINSADKKQETNKNREVLPPGNSDCESTENLCCYLDSLASKSKEHKVFSNGSQQGKKGSLALQNSNTSKPSQSYSPLQSGHKTEQGMNFFYKFTKTPQPDRQTIIDLIEFYK